MILRLFCILTFLLSLPILAQEPLKTATVDLKFSSPFKPYRNSHIEGVQLEKDGHYFALRTVGRISFSRYRENPLDQLARTAGHMVLEEYDSNFQLIRESDDFWLDWRDYDPERLGLTTNANGDLCVVVEGKGARDKENTIVVALFNVDPLSLEVEKESEKKIVVEIADPKAAGYGLGSFQFVSSKNGEYQALIYDYSEESTKQIIEAYVFDKNWNLQYSRIDKMPIKSELAELLNCSVSDSGETHLLLKQYKKKKEEFLRDKANYELVLRSFSDESSELLVQSIDLSDNLVQAVNMAEAPNGDIVIAANLGAIGSESPERLLCARLSSLKDTIYPLGFVSIPEDTIAKDLKLGSAIEKAFAAPEIYFGNEGGVYLISERVALTKEVLNYSDDDGTLDRWSRYAGLLIGYFNAAGNNWFDYVNKDQMSKNALGKYSSFVATTKGEELHLFYMPFHYAQLFSRKVRNNFRHLTFSPNQKRETEVLFSGKDLKVTPFPRFAYSDANNRLVIPFVSGRKSAFILLELKD